MVADLIKMGCCTAPFIGNVDHVATHGVSIQNQSAINNFADAIVFGVLPLLFAVLY